MGADPQLDDAQAASQCGARMEKFLRAVGMQCRLQEIGVQPGQIDTIADVTCSSMAFCMNVTLKKLDRSDIVEILRRAL